MALLLNADNPKPFPKAFIDRVFNDTDSGSKRAISSCTARRPILVASPWRLQSGFSRCACQRWSRRGDGDKYLLVRFAQAQAQFFDARVHVLPNVGHWPMIDEPERVRELVLPFPRAHVRGIVPASEDRSAQGEPSTVAMRPSLLRAAAAAIALAGCAGEPSAPQPPQEKPRRSPATLVFEELPCDPRDWRRSRSDSRAARPRQPARDRG